MTTTPRVKKTALELRLARNHKTAEAMQSARRTCAGAYELGGATGVVWITLCRDTQGFYSSLAERDELLLLQSLASQQMDAEEQAGAVTPIPFLERAERSHQRIVERAKRDRELNERRHLERCGNKPAGSPARLQSECRVIRPSDAMAERVLAEMAAQGPTPLLEEEESTPEINDESRLDQACDACLDHPAGDGDSRNANADECPDSVRGDDRRTDLYHLQEGLQLTPAPTPTRNWSTNCKGEMGARLARNIERVLEQICGPKLEDESTWLDDEFPWELATTVLEEVRCEGAGLDALLDEIRSDESLVVPRTEVAPLVGADDEVLPVVVSDAGASEFTAAPSPLDGESAWGLLCPVPEFSPSDLQELTAALDQHAEMAAIGLVAAITRAKLTLSGISPWTAPDAPISIGAGDLVVLLRSALRGVR